jgi:hypothetical protein
MDDSGGMMPGIVPACTSTRFEFAARGNGLQARRSQSSIDAERAVFAAAGYPAAGLLFCNPFPAGKIRFHLTSGHRTFFHTAQALLRLLAHIFLDL